MPPRTQLRESILNAIQAFSGGELKPAALDLLGILGYESDKTISISPNTAKGFALFVKDHGGGTINNEKARTDEWRSIDFLFQLTDEEITQAQSLFDNNSFDLGETRIESYIFFAIELSADAYSRTKLADITREINKVFPMPVMIIFRYGGTITFSIIDRRVHKREEHKDVLGKVTLIKDIRLKNPHTAHVHILEDLALPNLKNPRSWVELHHAWQNVLNISNLNKKFYKRIVEWFNGAIAEIRLPDTKARSEAHKDFAMRLIARLIFVWFLKELGVVDERLLLPDSDLIEPKKKGSNYYNFVLQNLFFNALNTDHGERDDSLSDFDIHASAFEDSEEIKALIANCPFLNGGLFDEEVNDYVARNGANNAFTVPDEILIGESGLNSVLKDFKFTVTENTPLEEEIAVEPDMLGRIFENLLAEQAADTQEAARKSAGAFYTPRPIVSYMCKNVLLRHLGVDVTPKNGKKIVHRLLETKILDPACGSGAFPMGMLEEMMEVLKIADPDGMLWAAEMMESDDADFRNYVAEFLKDKQFRYIQKLGLLRNCLYGVDILSYAVEITKLRCWLSLIVEQKVDVSKPNFNLKPLPNLEFKFYQKNSLLRTFKGRAVDDILKHFDKERLFEELIDLENNFFVTQSDKNRTKDEIRGRITELLEELVDSQLAPLEGAEKLDLEDLNRKRGGGYTQSEIRKAEKRYEKTVKSIAELTKFRKDVRDYFIEPIVFPTVFGPSVESKGFDIVIGNPPYVNTKLISQMNLTDTLKGEYGYVDDLYNHFTIRGMELVKAGGFLTYITSDTFLTLQTKENMRVMFLSVDRDQPLPTAKSSSKKVKVPPQQLNLSGRAEAVQVGLDFASNGDELFEYQFDPYAKCRLLELVNTPKAFSALVDTAIFTLQKKTPDATDEIVYVDIRSPSAEMFDIDEAEWQFLKTGTDNYASWEKILDRTMAEIQLPFSAADVRQPAWSGSHTCDRFAIGRDGAAKVEKYRVPLVLYHHSLNYALFAPNEWNCRVYDKVLRPAFPILKEWWEKIETSKKIENNRGEIAAYVETLVPGEITLLGLITDGGQGLATGDNGRFVGAIEGSRVAERIAETRPQKLMEAVEAHPQIKDDFPVLSHCETWLDYSDQLSAMDELEIRKLFDAIKDAYGRRVFGKGYLYRIVSPDEEHSVESMTADEKKSGINSATEVFVPYDKGDREGNRWYLETPYRLNWSRATVREYQTSTEARWQAYQFYFQEGFCWSDIHTILIKARLKGKSVHDVKSMTLFNQADEVTFSTEIILAILNSQLMSHLTHEFLNSTSTLQINDARRIPLVVPTESSHRRLKGLVTEAISIKKRQFVETSRKGDLQKLTEIENEIESELRPLYGLKL